MSQTTQGVGVPTSAAGSGVAGVRADVSPLQDASGNALVEQAVQLASTGGAAPMITDLLTAILSELRLQRVLFAEAFNLPDFAQSADDADAANTTTS